MSKYTPGPWGLETVPTSCGTCHKIGPFPSNGVYSETHACVYADKVRAHDYGHSKTGDELLANARLIAAAPDLLDALMWYVENDDVNIGQEGNEPYEAGLRRAQAAIAKAKGDQ